MERVDKSPKSLKTIEKLESFTELRNNPKATPTTQLLNTPPPPHPPPASCDHRSHSFLPERRK